VAYASRGHALHSLQGWDSQGDTDQGSRGQAAINDVSDDDGAYSAATEASEEEQQAPALWAQEDTLGQQTQRPTQTTQLPQPQQQQQQLPRSGQREPALTPLDRGSLTPT
jgi:hypothetical protein